MSYSTRMLHRRLPTCPRRPTLAFGVRVSASFVLGLLAGCSPIDVGTLGGPAGLGIDAIEDGSPAGRSGRALTLGDVIRVTAKLSNRGRVAVSGLDVRLTFRREPEGSTPEAMSSVVGAAPTSVAQKLIVA